MTSKLRNNKDEKLAFSNDANNEPKVESDSHKETSPDQPKTLGGDGESDSEGDGKQVERTRITSLPKPAPSFVLKYAGIFNQKRKSKDELE
jgi:hypothetical protein